MNFREKLDHDTLVYRQARVALEGLRGDIRAVARAASFVKSHETILMNTLDCGRRFSRPSSSA